MTVKQTADLQGLEKDGDVRLTTAKEFLDHLNPRDDRWAWVNGRSPWIFRGQANSDWPLWPLAERSPEAFLKFGVQTPVDTAEARWKAYESLVDTFRGALHEAGLRIPEEDLQASGRYYGVNGALHDRRLEGPLAALAQHHELPTHLLDWSRNARCAAYFAAFHAVNPTPKTEGLGTHLAVWALYAERASEGRLQLHLGPARELRREDVHALQHLRVYEAPTWSNPNLAAQDGLFTLLGRVSHSERNSLDRFVANAKRDGFELHLRRATLPRDHAPTLLRLLAYERVSGATLFPGVDGVVRSMRERALWDTAVMKQAAPSVDDAGAATGRS